MIFAGFDADQATTRAWRDNTAAPAFGDLADGFRSVANVLEGGLFLMFDADPKRPFFRSIVTRTRKMLGDNPDAIYYTAPVCSDLEYRVTANLAGSVYLSFTVEVDTSEGGFSTRTAGVLNNRNFDVAADGSFELFIGGNPRDANWLELPDSASEVIVRCYFEEAAPAAADPNRHVPLTIEARHDPGPPARWDEASVAAGLGGWCFAWQTIF